MKFNVVKGARGIKKVPTFSFSTESLKDLKTADMCLTARPKMVEWSISKLKVAPVKGNSRHFTPLEVSFV